HPVANVHVLGEEVAVGKMDHNILVPGPLDGHFDVRTLILDGMDRAADGVGFCGHGSPALWRFGDCNTVSANGATYVGVRRNSLCWEACGIALAAGAHQRGHAVRDC